MGYSTMQLRFGASNAEIREALDREWNITEGYEVLKSSLRGSTYYAAVQKGDKVFAVVTIVSKSDGYIWEKTMDETCMPYRFDCPVSILDLLTPTDNAYANEWRRLSRETAGRPKLSKLPYGAKICVDMFGKKMILTKMAPAYQFKTDWYMTEQGKYVQKKHITDFTLVV